MIRAADSPSSPELRARNRPEIADCPEMPSEASDFPPGRGRFLTGAGTLLLTSDTSAGTFYRTSIGAGEWTKKRIFSKARSIC